jgi:hypothetical protein
MLGNMPTSQAKWRRLFPLIALVLGMIWAPAKAGPATQPSYVLDETIAATVRDAVANQTFQRSDVKGGAFAKHEFEDASPDGVLIGFHFGIGLFFTTEVIKYVQPIYLDAARRENRAGVRESGQG